MANLNKVLLIGNLTRDVDLKYVPSGAAVANFGLAVNKAYTNSDGEKVDDVCYIEIVAWNKLAEICGEYLIKGKPVFGSLSSGNSFNKSVISLPLSPQPTKIITSASDDLAYWC